MAKWIKVTELQSSNFVPFRVVRAYLKHFCILFFHTSKKLNMILILSLYYLISDKKQRKWKDDPLKNGVV